MCNLPLYPLVSGYACYYCCMPSSPVLLYILLLFHYFLALLYIPTSFNILMEMSLHLYHYVEVSLTLDDHYNISKAEKNLQLYGDMADNYAFPAIISHISKYLPLWKCIIFVQC